MRDATARWSRPRVLPVDARQPADMSGTDEGIGLPISGVDVPALSSQLQRAPMPPAVADLLPGVQAVQPPPRRGRV